MQWLVQTVQQMCSTPLSVDSSNIEIIEKGLETCAGHGNRTLLNSASLERIEDLDLARRYNAQVIVTAAGQKGMPENAEERFAHASRMVDTALSKGIEIRDIYIDPLVFPISVDMHFGNHCLEAIRRLRHNYGARNPHHRRLQQCLFRATLSPSGQRCISDPGGRSGRRQRHRRPGHQQARSGLHHQSEYDPLPAGRGHAPGSGPPLQDLSARLSQGRVAVPINRTTFCRPWKNCSKD